MAPYWLVAGLSPVQGATTGAFMALGMGSSSLAAFRGSGHLPKTKTLTVSLLIMTTITSAVGPLFLPYISLETFKPLLAIVTIVSLPLLFINQKRHIFSRHRQNLGLLLLAALLLLSSFITSSAFSIMIAIVLSQLFGLTILQSTAMRRAIGLSQSAVIFIILVSLGGFVWQHAIAALLGGTIGSYCGTKFAIHKGERFAKYALALGALLSSLVLLIR